MPGVCPQCHRQATVESEFCPACGAPMNPDANRIRLERLKKTQALLPMKWHKFLTFFSLPAGLIMNFFNLLSSVNMLLEFDPSIYRPEALNGVKLLMYGDMLSALLIIPLFILAERNLLKMRKSGVKAVLGLYLFQAVYALFSLLCFYLMKPDLSRMENMLSLVQTALISIEMLIMFILVRVYYRKRDQLFS